MRSYYDDLSRMSQRILEQSNTLARIVDESNILRATSDKLFETLRAQLRAIKLELGRWSDLDERDSSGKKTH
jgi:hypothetical protein